MFVWGWNVYPEHKATPSVYSLCCGLWDYMKGSVPWAQIEGEKGRVPGFHTRANDPHMAPPNAIPWLVSPSLRVICEQWHEQRALKFTPDSVLLVLPSSYKILNVQNKRSRTKSFFWIVKAVITYSPKPGLIKTLSFQSSVRLPKLCRQFIIASITTTLYTILDFCSHSHTWMWTIFPGRAIVNATRHDIKPRQKNHSLTQSFRIYTSRTLQQQ